MVNVGKIGEGVWRWTQTDVVWREVHATSLKNFEIDFDINFSWLGSIYETSRYEIGCEGYERMSGMRD